MSLQVAHTVLAALASGTNPDPCRPKRTPTTPCHARLAVWRAGPGTSQIIHPADATLSLETRRTAGIPHLGRPCLVHTSSPRVPSPAHLANGQFVQILPREQSDTVTIETRRGN